MTGDTPLSRRRLLASGALALTGAFAGCADDETGDADGSTGATGATDSPADLDRQEANVVGTGVTVRDGDYRFDVTLHHDDAGEDGYANWWQVERLDGTRLGRRDLSHPHSEQPFTRSATISVPESVDCVVVRGHDQTHGYGGQAMVVTPDSGATRAVSQGSDPRSSEGMDCP
ncbi:hypothetical protein [Halorientalis sp.]|jgi:hypothetical protein|uniref:hypothetical protein n=1 Tax=Halorientalis sp. TaxID=1931229 RepID=UPI0026249FCC|nr:hypothetical protein [Halorientalis sp.]